MNQGDTPAGVGLSEGLGGIAREPAVWYEVCRYGRPTIKPVRVLRETAYQIVLADCSPGNARRGKADTYYQTWAEAHAHLLRLTQRELYVARAALEMAQGRHGHVKGLTPNV